MDVFKIVQGPHSPRRVPLQVFPGHFPGQFSSISRFLSLRGSAKSAIFQIFPGWILEAISQMFSFFPSANKTSIKLKKSLAQIDSKMWYEKTY